MTLLIGWFIVVASIGVGFVSAGGKPTLLFAPAEWLIVGGCGLGYVIAASPMSVIKQIWRSVLRSCRGTPFSKQHYTDAVQMLYEIFLVGRQQGIIGLETHVMEPQTSPIITRYPFFLHHREAMEFLTDSMKPVIDGKMKVDALRAFVDQQFEEKQLRAYQPVLVLNKVTDALPGLGIVAAVLGIVITMANMDADVAEVGRHVAEALVGTFLGVFLSYGFTQPLATNIEFLNQDELAYIAILKAGIVAFTSGAAPLTTAEYMRVCIPEDRRVSSGELEDLLKSHKTPAK